MIGHYNECLSIDASFRTAKAKADTITAVVSAFMIGFLGRRHFVIKNVADSSFKRFKRRLWE